MFSSYKGQEQVVLGLGECNSRSLEVLVQSTSFISEKRNEDPESLSSFPKVSSKAQSSGLLSWNQEDFYFQPDPRKAQSGCKEAIPKGPKPDSTVTYFTDNNWQRSNPKVICSCLKRHQLFRFAPSGQNNFLKLMHSFNLFFPLIKKGLNNCQESTLFPS